MSNLAVVVGISGALTLGAMSPGPSFLMVARTAVTASRRDGLAAALGMGLGGMLLSGLSLVGLHMLLAAVPWLYMALKLAGGGYLLYLGCCIWRGAASPLSTGDGAVALQPRLTRSFWLGLVTQLSNPKTAIVYASVFTAFLPASFPLSLGLLLVLMVFTIETLWYAIVALALSSSRPRAWYLRYKVWIDRAAGAVMGGLGAKLILNARSD